MYLVETHFASLVWTTKGVGELAPSNFQAARRLCSKHMNLLETHHASIVLAHGAPQPPAVFSRARIASRNALHAFASSLPAL